MLFGFVVAFVTCIDFLTTGETEPAVGLGVMAAATAFRELGAGRETESFFLTARARRQQSAGGG
jgi:hypothetical protein